MRGMIGGAWSVAHWVWHEVHSRPCMRWAVHEAPQERGAVRAGGQEGSVVGTLSLSLPRCRQPRFAQHQCQSPIA
jgi:hypothetical protein